MHHFFGSGSAFFKDKTAPTTVGANLTVSVGGQMQAPEHMFQCQQVLGIRYKKTGKRQVGYLSEDETKTLLSMPDTETRKGRRDQAMLSLLYDSGARVQELADLRVGDLRLDFPAQVKLTGKGRKIRSVPLMDKTTALLKNYL